MAQSGSGGSVDVTIQDNFAIVCMKRGQNRFNLEFTDQINAALDKIESDESITCVILTAQGKYFSLGLDLDWITSLEDQSVMAEFQSKSNAMIWRLLTFPVLTIAAINGHCYAAGLFLALACDQRVMTSDKGWACLSETRVGIPLSHDFFRPYLRCTLPNTQVYRDAAVLSTKYTPQAALQAGIVQALYKPENIIEGAKERANATLSQGPLGREILQQNKIALNGEVYDVLIKNGVLKESHL